MPGLESANGIDLWLCYYAATGEQQRAALGALLSDAEREQQQRFYFADDRLRYLVTRAMVRTVLSRYAQVAPQAWTFDTNAYGRPGIGAAHDVPPLSFNVSHSRGLIALAVSGGRALGVDVENVALRQPALEVADHFFSHSEVAALNQLPEALRHERFFEYWTLKESYIKARGMGLTLPLDQFSFHFPNERTLRLAIAPSLGDDAAHWQFWHCRPAPDYQLALCAARVGGASPAITARILVPAVGHDIVALDWLRTG